jgi:hypothetical protein
MKMLSQCPNRTHWCVIEWDGKGYAKRTSGFMYLPEAKAELAMQREYGQ